MANVLYGKGKEKLLSKLLDLSNPGDTIKAALVLSTYTVDLVTHEFYTDLGANVVGTNQTLTTKSVTGGVFDADDVTWTAVPASGNAASVVLFKDTGVAATSPLIAFMNVITNFPVTTNGGDITVQWDNGAYKIFSL